MEGMPAGMNLHWLLNFQMIWMKVEESDPFHTTGIALPFGIVFLIDPIRHLCL